MRSCPGGAELARYVDGAFASGEQEELCAHLGSCARCRAAVEELRALVRGIAAGPVGPEIDLAPLVLRRAALPPPRRRWMALVAIPVAATAALVLGVELRRTVRADQGFQARGGSDTDDTWVALRAFRVDGGELARLPERGGHMRAGDGILLAYDNGGPRPYRYLVVVGVDAAGRHYFYQPDSSAAAATGIAIDPGAGRELREEVRFPLAPGPLRLRALFSRAPISLGAVEAALSTSSPGARLPFPETGQHELVVDVDGR